MKIRTIILVLLLKSLSCVSQSQNPCPSVNGCIYQNNFQTSTPIYVNTDSVANITDTSATLYGWASTMDACCNSGIYPMQVTAIAAWSTDCYPVCNSNLGSLDTAVIVYNHTKWAAWINNINTSIQLKNLKPNTTYYVRYMVCRSFYGDSIPPSMPYWAQGPMYCIGNILTFTTKKGLDPIANNQITSGDQVICASGNPGTFTPQQINASTVTGGNGLYTFVWQKRVKGSQTWENCANGNTANYTPESIVRASLVNPVVQYRRVVTSGNVRDTSNYITVTYNNQLGVPLDASAPYGFVTPTGLSGITDSAVVVTGTFNLIGAVNAFDAKYGKGAASSLGTNFVITPQVSISFINPRGKRGKYSYANVSTTTYTVTSANYETIGNSISYTMSITGLRPSTTFYVGQYVQVQINNSCPFPRGQSNLVNFYVQKGSSSVSFQTLAATTPPIENNIITSGDQVICAQGNPAMFMPLAITAGMPSGGDENYKSIWQKSNDGGVTWANTNNSGDFLTHTPQAFAAVGLPYTDVSYRRIISSAEHIDTSSSITITYLPLGYVPVVNIRQLGFTNTDFILRLSVNNTIDSYNVFWTDSLIDKGKTRVDPQSTNDFIPPTLAQADMHVYQANVVYGNSCPVYTSNLIYVSTPDGDGNRYAGVQIKNQIWTINNIRTTKFNNGVPIEMGSNYKQKPSYTWYNNDSMNYANKFGALYNVVVINNGMGLNVCPTGWDVAGVMNWMELVTDVGGKNNVGLLLKSDRDWMESDYRSNAYNFNAIPSGELLNKFNLPVYQGKYESCEWWSFVPDIPGWKPYNQSGYLEFISGDNNAYFINKSETENADYISQRSIRCFRRVR